MVDVSEEVPYSSRQVILLGLGWLALSRSRQRLMTHGDYLVGGDEDNLWRHTGASFVGSEGVDPAVRGQEGGMLGRARGFPGGGRG